MNGWMNERVKERTNEWMNKHMDLSSDVISPGKFVLAQSKNLRSDLAQYTAPVLRATMF